jgi:hypothetical protein
MIHNHEVIDNFSVIESGRFFILADTVYNKQQQEVAMDLLTLNDEIGEELES